MLKCKVEKCCLIGVHRFDFMLSDLFFVCVFRGGGVVIEITNRFCYEYDIIRDKEDYEEEWISYDIPDL